MAVLARDMRKKFWFGTEERMEFLPTPLRGADVSPVGWEAGGTTLNGGGYQSRSFGSHKNYIFEWSGSSSKEVANLMSAYAAGTYGRRLIYFIDPLTYDTNILPAMWADPSMGLGLNGASLISGQIPEAVPTSNWQANNLPVQSARYTTNGAAGWRGEEDSVFIPIPEGYGLALGAFYSYTGTGRVMYVTQSAPGSVSSVIELPPLSNSSNQVVNHVRAGVSGIRLFIGRNSLISGGTVTISAMIARLFPLQRPDLVGQNRWMAGEGNSGCRFVGHPTLIRNSGVGGGQVGFAATFREVGSWR